MDETRECQIYEISRDDFEKMGQSLGAEEGHAAGHRLPVWA
jgi:hypothetical protein